MRRIIVTLILAVLVPSGAYAEENGGTPAMLLSIKAGAAFTNFQVCQTVDLEFTVMLGEIFGIGVEAGLEYGYLLTDIYATTVVQVRVWWFYAGIGVFFKLSDAVLPADGEYTYISYASAGGDAPFPFALKVGVSVPVFKVGPGMLGLNGFAIMHDMDRPRKPGDGWAIMLPITPCIELMYRIPLS